MKTILKRIWYFAITNILIVVLLSVIWMILVHIFPWLRWSLSLTSTVVSWFLFGFLGAFISLWLSKFSAKNMLGVREFTSEEQFNPKVQVIIQTVERISQQEGIKTPEIGIYTSHDVNAFATGATKNSSLVAVSTELLQQMSEKEIEGVIGHEMAHIVNGDMVTLTLIQGVVNTFVYILSEALSRLVSQVLDKEYGFLFRLLSSIVFQILFGVLASIFVNYVSRKREYAADALSAKLLGKEPMIAALKKLDVLHGMQREERDPKMAPFMITDEKEKDGLFSTHPTLKNRIIALEQSY